MVRRPAVVVVHNAQRSSSPKPLCQLKPNFMWVSLGRGNNILFAASGSHDQDGRHAHICKNPSKISPHSFSIILSGICLNISKQNQCESCPKHVLAHLSQRLIDELIVYAAVRPSIHQSIIRHYYFQMTSSRP